MKNGLKILVLFYSMYGHTFRRAQAVVKVGQEASCEAILKQVEEIIPEES